MSRSGIVALTVALLAIAIGFAWYTRESAWAPGEDATVVTKWERRGDHGTRTDETRAAAVHAAQVYGDVQAMPAEVGDRVRYVDAHKAERAALLSATFDAIFAGEMEAAIDKGAHDELYRSYERYELGPIAHTYQWDSGSKAFVVFETTETYVFADGTRETSPKRQFQVTLRKFGSTWETTRFDVFSLVPGDRT